MKFLDLTLTEPAANLAMDEALLDFCEDGSTDEVLRFWAPQDYFVVIGYGNQMQTEVNLPECERRQIPVLRRCSGGGTVVQGAGCLNYAVILKIRDEIQSIPQSNAYVMDRQKAALEKVLGQPVHVRGHTDLAVGELKFSGNAQRRKKNFLIFHGTFLLNFDLALIEACLLMPSRQPFYRQNRSHQSFLTNLNVSAEVVKNALMDVWGATDELGVVPDCTKLVQEKYGNREWSRKF